MNQQTTPNLDRPPAKHGNKLGVVAFLLVIAGPLLLMFASLLQPMTGDFPVFLANAVVCVCLALPAAGFILAIISLFRWKKSGVWGRALSVSTIVIGNPFFYYFYLIICIISSSSLAGLPWM